MGRIARLLLVGTLALLALVTCKNPLLSIVEDKVTRSKGDPNIQVSYKGVIVAAGFTLDIGNTVANQTRTATFTIANTGKAPLTLSGNPLVVIGGTDAALFALATLPYQTVEAGANTTFSLEFTPSSVGVKTATLTVTSNDPDLGTYSFTITGRGVASAGPAIQVSQGATILDNLPYPPPFDFGSIRSSSTKDVVFTVTNVGTPGSTLNLSGTTPVKFITGDFARFSVAVPPSSLALLDGETATFTARFSPTSGVARSYSTTMEIVSNALDEPTYDVSLTGYGAEPDIALYQNLTLINDGTTYGTSLGSVKADGPNEDAGTAVTFTIKNTGSWPLSITSVTLAGTNPSDFVLTNSTSSPVAVGGSTSFSVKFDPSSAPGSKTATVTIGSDVLGSKNPYTFDVTGTATFAKKVYWVVRDYYKLMRANLNGSNPETILTGLSDPTGLAIDQTNHKIYIGESGHISVANLDGTGKTALSGPSVAFPYGLAVDSTCIYWADYYTNRIGRALLDGSGATTYNLPGPGYGISVGQSTDDLYFTTYGPPCLYHGSKSALAGGVIYGSGGYGAGVAFDETNSHVYFADNGLMKIFRLDMGVIASAWASSIAVDAADGYIFYTDYAGSVWRAGLDGSGAAVIANAGNRAYGIALDLVP